MIFILNQRALRFLVAFYAIIRQRKLIAERGYIVGNKAKLDCPVTLHNTYTITIDGLGNSGEGVGRVDGFTVFVPFALPSEVVEVEIDVVKKNYATGVIRRILQSSKHRVEPVCPVYGQCGGCQLQHVTYEEQTRLKTQKVRDIIERIGKTDSSIVKDTLGPSNPWHYRNKMQMPVGEKEGQPVMGFYEIKSHQIVHCTDCAIQEEANNQLATTVYNLLVKEGIEPYNEITGTGVLRHVIGRIGHATTGEEWMLVLVTATKTIPHVEQWIETITKQYPLVKSIVLNYNPQKTNVIMGKENTLLWGQEYITDSIKNLEFRLSPHSFFQVNPQQTTVLYDKALEYADLKGDETVIDAYCGTGTISLFLANKAKKVIGIEIVEPAIIDARENAKRNGFTNTEFIVADAAKAMPDLYKKGVRPDVIVFDPIRAGCKPEVLEAAAAMEPKRIVYVSCNPASMARDMVLLRELGYKVVEVQPVDMFPMSSHVECVALMSRVQK